MKASSIKFKKVKYIIIGDRWTYKNYSVEMGISEHGFKYFIVMNIEKGLLVSNDKGWITSSRTLKDVKESILQDINKTI